MVDAIDQIELAPDRNAASRWGAALANAARSAGPPLLFGLRLWASVCLALYVAFWLELSGWSLTTLLGPARPRRWCASHFSHIEIDQVPPGVHPPGRRHDGDGPGRCATWTAVELSSWLADQEFKLARAPGRRIGLAIMASSFVAA